MKNKTIYRRRDILEHFGISPYVLRQRIADGEIPAPVKKDGRTAYWTAQMVRRAEMKMSELARPTPEPETEPTVRIRPFSAKQKAQIRASMNL